MPKGFMENIQQDTIFGTLTTEDFLKEYWHKKPLLIKGFHPTPEKLASVENILDMAKDENFESRIIFPPNKDNNWIAKEGPVLDEDLKKEEFTVAVHGLDIYFEEFHKIKKAFSFIPSWQFDDIMATYSLPGIGVGAHIDNYDVFIFQGSGTRKWSLDTNPNPGYIEGIDIKILKEFNPDIEWVLEPGDMVYLPPKIAHHGESLTTSISYSIGFKAEDSENILNDFAMNFLSEFESSDFVSHPGVNINSNPNLITNNHLNTIKEHIIDKFFDDEKFKKWTQSYLAKPRSPIPEGETISDIREVYINLANGEELFFDPSVKFNYTKDGSLITLNISTIEFKLSNTAFSLLEPILETPSFQSLDISTIKENKDIEIIILKCISYGIIYFN